MLSRLVIIITCVSLVGVTIVPASSIPCCCKSIQANYRDQCGIVGPQGRIGADLLFKNRGQSPFVLFH